MSAAQQRLYYMGTEYMAERYYISLAVAPV